ncbi:hypothetical protein L0156_16600, partial [bacterium]|nr:hypothetical protein [bacterium]
IGIAVIRIVYMLLFVITRLKPLDLIGASFWIGWVLTLAAVELWIRRTSGVAHHHHHHCD